MAWSNTAERSVMVVEKSHGFSFSVRVEDRLHRQILQPTDLCWFTVRPAEYTMGVSDDDIVEGTSLIPGTGIKASGVITGTGEEQVFTFNISAAAMNLDPETDYFYAISYVRDGFSMSLQAGEFEVQPNPVNRGPGIAAIGTAPLFSAIATLDGRNLLTVSSSLPLPREGDPGNGSYVINRALSKNVGETVSVQLDQIVAPGNRAVQVGDVIFSSVTSGVLATVQAIVPGPTTMVTIMTRQAYGQEALKALLDTVLRIPGVPNLEVVGTLWVVQKSAIPLPPGYDYQVGDLLFSHSAESGMAANKKLLISLVETISSTTLAVRTKVIFPIFLDPGEFSGMIADKVSSNLAINGKQLKNDITLTEDDIPTGSTNSKFTAIEKTKLTALPTNTALNASFGGKANTVHSHTISDVSDLQNSLDGKTGSTTIRTIWSGTNAQYTAINPKNSNTLYFIRE